MIHALVTFTPKQLMQNVMQSINDMETILIETIFVLQDFLHSCKDIEMDYSYAPAEFLIFKTWHHIVSSIAKVGNGWAQAQSIMSSAQAIFMPIVQPINAPFHV